MPYDFKKYSLCIPNPAFFSILHAKPAYFYNMCNTCILFQEEKENCMCFSELYFKLNVVCSKNLHAQICESVKIEN
jgi:hypothetical protein